MNVLRKLVLFVAICIVAQSLYGKKLTGKQIMQMVKDQDYGKDRKGTTSMILINKNNEKRTRKVLFFEKDYGDDSKNIMYFKQPADVEGTAFLQFSYESEDKDDAKWLYLPALKKLRRIASSKKNDSFMGTDFTYDDMGKRSIDESTYKLKKETKCGKHKCWVVESFPKDKTRLYSKIVSWVRQDAKVVVRADYYDKKGKPLKQMKVLNLKKHQGYWTAFETEMHNVQEKHKTIMKIDSIKYNVGLKDRLFNQRTIKKGHLR